MNKPQPFLAILLSLAVILLFSDFLMPSSESPEVENKENISAPQKNNKEENSSLVVPTSNPSQTIQDSSLNSFINPPAEEIAILENDFFRAEISSYAGIIKSWKLKKYQETTDKESPLIDLFKNQIDGEAFGLRLNHPEFDKKPFFSISQPGSDKIILNWQSAHLKISRTIEIDQQNPYLLTSNVVISNLSNQDISLNPSFQVRKKQTEDTGSGGFLSFMMGPENVYQPLFVKDDELTKITDFEELEQEKFEKGIINWSGLSDRYFLISLISHQSSPDTEISYGKVKDFLYSNLGYSSYLIQSNEKQSLVASLYVGPKIRDELKQLPYKLEKSVDYGFLEPVAIGLLWLLFQFQKLVGNWGIAIIFLTFFVKILLHPINKKSMTSMKAMQKIQPKLKEIREKYKNDRQKLNLEMMQLFKTHKVNPMGGCLPMIIQMPVYFALYQVLWNAIELYHTPFFWFYKDLSAADPYFVSPILLGVFMVLQQKFNPQAATMEPAQQKMMMIMPVVFTGVMAFFPFGLVLYILVNTIMSVVQQYMIHEDLSFIQLIKKLLGKKKAA